MNETRSNSTIDDAATSAGPAAIPHAVFCPGCAYDLRGATGERCSECGYSLSSLRQTESQIPWVHRQRIGRFRAYWQTVWLVTFRNRRFCEEYARPVDYAGSQSFRWLTVLHAYVPILLLTAWTYLLITPVPISGSLWRPAFPTGFDPFEPTTFERAVAEVWPVVILHICWLVFVALATGVPSYFFHPRRLPVERQNNAVALSYYACAPFALLVVPLIMAPNVVLQLVLEPKWRLVLLAVAFLVLAAIVVAWWLNLVRIVSRTMPQLARRRWAVGVGVALCWLLLGGLTLFILPLAILYILIIFASLV